MRGTGFEPVIPGEFSLKENVLTKLDYPRHNIKQFLLNSLHNFQPYSKK